MDTFHLFARKLFPRNICGCFGAVFLIVVVVVVNQRSFELFPCFDRNLRTRSFAGNMVVNENTSEEFGSTG